MHRLIAKGLMFANLVHVDSPALAERYNRALKHLSGRTTGLTDFYIDIAGFSPEVADELGDPLYLNPNGVNRQFILLTTAQKHAPLLDAEFSSSREILIQFIEANESDLFALTAKDAVAGELANSVFEASTPARLFDIRRITVEADTTGNHIADARALTDKIDQFKSHDDAWFDDALIGEMIALARQTGDVTRNPISLTPISYDQKNFWTAHFGGIYAFRDAEHPAAITVQRMSEDLPIAHTFTLDDRNSIAHFFELNQLVEPIVRKKGGPGAEIIGQKMDFVLIDAAASMGIDLGGGSSRELRAMARQIGARLPAEFHGLAALKRWAEAGGPWPRISSDHPAYFYTLRARRGPDMDLVNQLLAELTPLDFRQLFICHKQAFYKRYAGFSDAKRAYVADFLERDYMIDKEGMRDALFGGASMVEVRRDQGPWSRSTKRKRDLVDLVGPWGSVLKGRK